MRSIYRAFAKKLFGVKYERAGRSVFVCLIVFGSLYMADIRLRAAPPVLYLMTVTLTAGVMRQSLLSEDNGKYMKNMLMLPIKEMEFICAYIGALGGHTLLTKAAPLWAVIFAVSHAGVREVMGSLAFFAGAVVVTSVIFYFEKGHEGAYSFYREPDGSVRKIRGNRRHSVCRYFFRYLADHKNYLANTIVLCGAACVLPVFLRQWEGEAVFSAAFAVLSINTPICILLSCDPSLMQAVCFLPGQKSAFFVPYAVFIFFFNLLADIVFLCSYGLWIGGVSIRAAFTAVLFALASAAGSALLERFFPIRSWKTESDLWHHPRKYVVPAVLLLLSFGLLLAAS